MNARMLARSLGTIALLGAGAAALAAGADLGQAEKQPTNWTAIGMFAVFVAGTLWGAFHVIIVLLQAFIFMMLTIVYLSMAHQHDEH